MSMLISSHLAVKAKRVVSWFACRWLTLSLSIVVAVMVSGVDRSAAQQGRVSPDRVWQERAAGQGRREVDHPQTARRFRLDEAGLLRRMRQAPREIAGRSVQAGLPEISLPLPDGRFVSFLVEESPVAEEGLLRRYPGISSYRGKATDGSGATMRCDWSPRGFHATVALAGETVFIHPAAYDAAERAAGGADYLAYAFDEMAPPKDNLLCEGVRMAESERLSRLTSAEALAALPQFGESLRTFRIAIATTQEFTNAPALGGGTVAGTVAALTTLLNGVNVIYERDLSIRLLLVANNDQVIYTAEPDPFTNDQNSTMLIQVRGTLRDRIGTANYDIGHVMSTGGGGVAEPGVVCNNTEGTYGPLKGAGVSSANFDGPVTSGVYVMAHEVGHQFNALHSFNALCNGNRTPSEAWESGAGLTIMSYANVCTEQIVRGPELRFHSGSIINIRNFLSGISCGTTTSTGNQPPTIDAGSDYTIPKQTPFSLSATAGDGDTSDRPNLTYTWEEYDSGGDNYPNPPYNDAGDPPGLTTRTLFRPFPVGRSLQRTFPSLDYILNYANDPPDKIDGLNTAEELPRIARGLTFAATVRDNRGGVAIDTVSLTVSGSSGPFLVTQPNSAGVSWTAGATQTVQWSVNGTDQSPVSCQNVRITLSVDGGRSFPIELAAAVPNTGSASIVVPAYVNTASARVRVAAVGNIFFDISDNNLTIVPATGLHAVTAISTTAGATGSTVVLTGLNLTGVTTVRFGGGVSATFTINSATQITATVPAGALTGPITLSKSGFADAFSPVFTVCSGSAATLSVDDGSYETEVGGGSSDHYVSRLTPAGYPATLTGVLLNLNLPAGTAISVVAGANPDGDGDISGSLTQVTAATVTATSTLTLYPVAPLTITSGDFVIGFRYTVADGLYPARLDTGGTQANRGYYGDGYNFARLPGSLNGNLAIRGQYHSSPNSCNFCTYAAASSAQSFAVGGGQGTVTITAGSGCGWQSASYSSWITIGSGASGSGSGTAGFTVAANSTGGARTGAIQVAGQFFNITQSSSCSLAITPTQLPAASAGVAYSQALNATGGTTPKSFSLTSGLLPTGLALSGDGIISGTPTVTGSFSFTVTATDPGGCSGSQSLTLTVSCPTITLSPSTLAPGSSGVAYSQTIVASPSGSYSYSVTTGSLPAGLTLNATTGALGGTPTATGSFTLTIRATNAAGCFGEMGYTLTIGTLTAIESDVAPRSNGNGSVNITDWVQAGRFVVGLDTAATGSEFQRADSAPRSTLGDGKISINDWVQAGRYSVGLDPATAGGGPQSPVAMAPSSEDRDYESRIGAATLRVVDGRLTRGVAGTIDLELDATGVENAISLTLVYDPRRIAFLGISSGGTTVVVNESRAHDGRLAIAAALPPGQSFPSGRHRFAQLLLLPLPGGDDSPLTIAIDDSLIDRQIVDLRAVSLRGGRYLGGSVRLDPQLPLAVTDYRREGYILNRTVDNTQHNTQQR